MLTRQLHGSGDEIEEPPYMILLYVMALSMSAGMSFSTCFAVFKWRDVVHDAGHGSTYMVFLCLGLWSSIGLARVIVVFLNDREDTLENSTVLYLSIPFEILFNATSLWFIVVAHEIKRRALHTGASYSQCNRMTVYSSCIFGLALCMLVILMALNSSHMMVEEVEYGKPKQVKLVVYAVDIMSWVTMSIRISAVLYGGAVALWLYWKRDRVAMRKLPMALVWIAGLFCILNTPYLLIEPFYDWNIIPAERFPATPSIVKFLTYTSGAILSLVMGLSVAGFDAFFGVYQRTSLSAKTQEELFVLSD
ncbi:unnamed protein product [Aphanomyces euteiches]|nr:hypothetical protein AeRB84_002501 [Aphanomyces euteiches]